MQQIRTKIIETLLETLLNNVKSGNCNLNDVAAEEVINILTAMNKNIYNITKRKACDKILRCSTATFELYRTMGLIPDGHKEYGSNELRWCENDFKEAIEYRRINANEVINK